MKTFKRIEKISWVTMFVAEQFDREIVVADIATDHGYIAEKLSIEEKIKNVIATDISAKSLSKLQKMIRLKSLSKITTIVGDGLLPIPDVDICVIAGIGGFEIRKMIENQNKTEKNTNKCNFFVLQPAQNAVELRHWIFDNNFKVLLDITIEDEERFYPIIAIDISKTEKNEKSIFNLWLGRDSFQFREDFMHFALYLKEYLQFTQNISPERARLDEMLFQKCELYKILDDYITDK